MTNDLVYDNKGIIGNYIVMGDKIHVFYLDGNYKELLFSYENLCEITNQMIDQAIKMINARKDEKFIMDKKIDTIKLSFATSIMAALTSIGIEAASTDSNTLRITLEAIAVVLTPIITFLYNNHKNIKIDNNYKKYLIFINNYKSFIDNSDNEELYEGIKNDTEICINTVDYYSLDDMNRMFNNLKRIKSKKHNK